MEQIKEATFNIIDQMTELAEQLSSDEFTRPLPILLENSIGKHFRHIIEFYEVMIVGAGDGEVNYDSRNHDPALEQSREKCMERLQGIRKAVAVAPDMRLKLSGSYSHETDKKFTVPSHLKRELIYNIEHAIHHLAIIRIALQQEFPHIRVGSAFGYAYSTLKHNNK